MTASAPFEAPAIDEYVYRLVKLDNGLEALLVHDKDADKAAAACDVRVGSMSDPEDMPGLAHFLEHMLFYSSAKYPKEDEYSKFIAEKGGRTNAYTANQSTQYHFDVAWDALPEALDRFAQFFICPLISKDGVDREAHAVDSEHGKNLNADAWRKLQLWRSTANPVHPMTKFSTGNLVTLIEHPQARGDSSHERLKQFYEEHYSASLMRLAVVGRHTLDELEALVREKFTPVVDRGLQPAAIPADPITPGQSGILIKVIPEKNGHSIELQWDTVSEQEHAAAAPLHYLSHLLGHEGDGSVFALLKARGWATSLVAGEASTSFSTRSFFMVRIELTDEGQRRVGEAVAVVFRYIELLRGEGGVIEAVWNEMRSLNRMKFDFRDKLDPYHYVSSLAHGMQVYPAESLLLSIYGVPLRYDPTLIRQALDDLTPVKARVMWASKELEPDCTSTEQWYGTQYCVGRLPAAWVEAWSGSGKIPAGLHMPAANEFVPKDFSLVEEAATQPRLESNTPWSKIWLRPDPTFKVPKAVVFLHLSLPEASYASPSAAVMTQLAAKLANDALSEVTYPADLAGLHYSLRSSARGLLASVSGYHDSLPRLATTVLEAALATDVPAHRFAVIKEKLAKDYANMRFEQPYQMALYEMSVTMEARRWHVADYEAELASLTHADLVAFLPRLLRKCHIEAYAAGNLPADRLSALIDALQEDLSTRCSATPPSASQAHEARVVKLTPGRPILLRRPGPNPANDNSATVVAFQVGADDLRRNALAALVTHVGRRPAYHQLRTVEQLGYLTFFSSFFTLTVRNLAFIIQSSAKTAAHLETRVEAFLPQLRDQLAALSAEEFAASVEELAKAKLERPKRLREVAMQDWAEVDDGTLRFNRQEEEVEELRKLTLADLLEFFDECLLSKATRRKFCVRVEAAKAAAGAGEEGSEEVEEGLEEVDDVFKWKRAQELFPSPC